VLAVVLAGCAGDREEESPLDAMEALIAFARTPSDDTSAAVPFADSVGLGLGPTLRARRSRDQLREPAAWKLDVDLFRARAGSASALELIASENRELRVTEGPHPHCASAPVPPPPQVSELERVAVQPRELISCLDWWTVDAFVNADGEIEAVTLDLWEP
jgi:hypothetical protein